MNKWLSIQTATDWYCTPVRCTYHHNYMGHSKTLNHYESWYVNCIFTMAIFWSCHFFLRNGKNEDGKFGCLKKIWSALSSIFQFLGFHGKELFEFYTSKSSTMPAKSTALVLGSQYLYSRTSLMPDIFSTELWFAKTQQSIYNSVKSTYLPFIVSFLFFNPEKNPGKISK